MRELRAPPSPSPRSEPAAREVAREAPERRTPTAPAPALLRGMGNRATGLLLRQPAPAVAANQPAVVPAAARRRLVFLMGQDRGGFYTLAERYWRVQEPAATFVTTARSLADVIDWMNANVTEPAGLIYIVSHANEDGTLSFGVDSQDQDHHMAFHELRDALHPPGGGPRTLPSLQHDQADNAIVHIKGCNIGRSPAILDLLAEAFGGHVAVYAPTHEQVYGYDPWIAAQAQQQMQSLIRSDAERHHPLPPPVDPALTGAARTAAVRERARLMAERTRAIAAEVRSRQGEVRAEMERQGVYEALSGPEVQQAGTDRISTERIRRHVEHFYPHLSDAQRATIVRRLDAGQQVQAIRPMSSDIAVPSTVPHVNAFWGQVLRDNHFVVTQLLSVNRATANGTLTVTAEVRGQLREPGQAPVTTTMTLTSEGLDDQTLLRDGRARVANPERYAWDVEETALGNGLFRRSARGRRMRGYLHHGSLDAGPHEHFRIEQGDLDYFGTNGLPAQAGVLP